MDENVTITRDYSRNQPSDSTMSHQILHAKVELRTRRTITITITMDYSRDQSSDSTMSHQILYARSNSGRAGLSTASIVHDLLMLYLALMIFDRSCGFDVVHQYKAVNDQ